MCDCFRTEYIAAVVMLNGRTTTGGIDILLVEDNRTDSSQIINTLKKANICNQIHSLRDGGDILDFLFRSGAYRGEETSFSETLILLSLNLEGLSGLDVLRKIKGDERSRNFPVIILASSQDQRGVMESYRLGANACIVKPLELPKLIEAVGELRLGWLLVPPEEPGSPKTYQP